MAVVTIDLHLHSTASDGTSAPADLMAAARAAGLEAVALTDHDTTEGHAEAATAAARLGLEFTPGLEFSTRHAGRPVHLLMYGGDAAEPALAAELARVRAGRDERLPRMLDRLAGLGMPLDLAEVSALAPDAASVGRPHVADAMVARGYVADRTEAFDRWLGDDRPGFVDRYATALPDAIALVRGGGGVAILAHPWSRTGRHTLPVGELTRLVAAGLDGFECDHPDHLPGHRAELHALADRLGVLATGSSDHHGSGKRAAYALGACTTAPAQYRRLRALIARRGGRAC